MCCGDREVWLGASGSDLTMLPTRLFDHINGSQQLASCRGHRSEHSTNTN
jgi:hypothetical protein